MIVRAEDLVRALGFLPVTTVDGPRVYQVEVRTYREGTGEPIIVQLQVRKERFWAPLRAESSIEWAWVVDMP
jgi:hypothetical protein